MALPEDRQQDFRILSIIREHPRLDAVALQAHGVVPNDFARFNDLRLPEEGLIEFKSGGWVLTPKGDLFLLRYWEGPVPTLPPVIEASPQSRRPSIKTERPVGFVKQVGAGEIIFRQAGHLLNDKALFDEGWRPVFWGADDV